MSEQPVSRLPDADMQAAPAALLRAARRGQEIARQTGTAVVMVRDGKLSKIARWPRSRPPQSRNRADRAWPLSDINSEDRLVQQTFAEHLEQVLDWESVYAYKAETFGPNGTLGRA